MIINKKVKGGTMYHLKAKRINIGISQQELAERLNVTPVWLNQIENKKKTSSKMESKIIEELNKIEQEKYGISIPTLS